MMMMTIIITIISGITTLTGASRRKYGSRAEVSVNEGAGG
jgi:hypothetical protein